MKSSFLEPQEPMNEDEIARKLTSYQFFIDEDIYFKKFNQTEIKHESYQQVIDSLEKENLIMSPSDLKPRIKYEGYLWNQQGNKILIHYSFKSPNLDKSVTITDDIITSGSRFILGRLYKPPNQSSITYDNLSVTIELLVNEPWPILIREGIPEIDADSSFLLAIAAQKLNYNSLSHRLFVYSAMQGHPLSIASVSYHYYTQSEENRQFYWNVKLFLSNGSELTSFMPICDKLLKLSDNGESARLAESILVFEAKREVPISFLYLGFLHMRQIDGFDSDKKLAFRYIETAALQYDVKKAYETLGKCYIGGVLVKKDVEKGVEMLQKANLTSEVIHEILRNEKETREKAEKVKKDGQWKTILITSSVTLVTLASIFIGIEFFTHKSKK